MKIQIFTDKCLQRIKIIAQPLRIPVHIADNKGKTYGLGRGTNHSRIEHYKEMLAELNLGLERLTMQLIGEDNVREATLFPRDLSRLEP